MGQPLLVFDRDIRKAHDFTRHGWILSALLTRGVDRPLVAAWLREFRRQDSAFTLNNAIQSLHIYRAGGFDQGDPALVFSTLVWIIFIIRREYR